MIRLKCHYKQTVAAWKCYWFWFFEVQLRQCQAPQTGFLPREAQTFVSSKTGRVSVQDAPFSWPIPPKWLFILRFPSTHTAIVTITTFSTSGAALHVHPPPGSQHHPTQPCCQYSLGTEMEKLSQLMGLIAFLTAFILIQFVHLLLLLIIPCVGLICLLDKGSSDYNQHPSRCRELHCKICNKKPEGKKKPTTVLHLFSLIRM